MIGFALHPEAYADLVEIRDYIAADSASAADRVMEEMRAAMASIARLPHMGHRRPDLTDRPLRFLRCYDYLIAYAFEERPVWVVAVLHGSRNPRLLAALLRDRRS